MWRNYNICIFTLKYSQLNNLKCKNAGNTLTSHHSALVWSLYSSGGCVLVGQRFCECVHKCVLWPFNIPWSENIFFTFGSDSPQDGRYWRICWRSICSPGFPRNPPPVHPPPVLHLHRGSSLSCHRFRLRSPDGEVIDNFTTPPPWVFFFFFISAATLTATAAPPPLPLGMCTSANLPSIYSQKSIEPSWKVAEYGGDSSWKAAKLLRRQVVNPPLLGLFFF